MKNSPKFLLLVLGAGLCLAPVLRAQDASPSDDAAARSGSHEKKREHLQKRGAHLAEVLGLSADQKARMKELNQQEKAAREAVRADASLDKEQKRAKAHEIHLSFIAQRDALLTPEQKAKADQLRAHAKAAHGPRPESPHGDGTGR